MLVATLEQERKKIYQQGEAKGRMATQQQTIGQLLQFRFDLAETEQRHLTQQVARLEDLHQLDALVNILLNKAEKFEDFTRLLTEYFPESQAE